jgi:hypothetical protein
MLMSRLGNLFSGLSESIGVTPHRFNPWTLGIKQALHTGLMTYEKGLFAQADPGIVSGSTIERKKMSTKTIYKRIALVAVTALGAGVLSVAPANAAINDNTLAVDGLSVTTPAVTVRVGDTASSTFSASFSLIGDATKFGSIVATMTKPTGSPITVGDKNGDGTVNDPIVTGTDASTAAGVVSNTGSDTIAGDVIKVIPAAGTAADASSVAGTISFAPDRPGTYVVTLTGTTLASPGVKNAITATFTVTVRSLAYTTGDGAAAAPFDTGAGIAGVNNTVTVTAHSTQVADVRALVTVEGAGATISSAVAGTGTSVVAANFLSARIPAETSAPVIINTPTAGTVTVKVFNETSALSGIYSATAANTVTITVGTAALNGIINSVKSAAVIKSGATFVNGASGALVDDAVAISGVTASSTTAGAVIKVTLTDALGTAGAANVTATVGATISGPGTLKLNTSDSGDSVGERLASLSNNGGDLFVRLFPDGTAGTSTVTITVTGTTGTFTATKTLLWLGSAKTLTAKAFEPHVGVGTITDVVEVIARDTAGNLTTGSFTALSSNPTVLSSSVSSCTQSAGSAGDLLAGKVKGAYYCSVTANAPGLATLTINPASLTTNSPTVDIRVTKGVAASITLTADKATYTPGEKITLSITAKDADGFLIGKGAADYDLLAAASTVKNATLTGTAFTDEAFNLSAGVATTTYFAPYGSGPITFEAVTSADAAVALAQQSKVLSVTVSVSSGADIAALAAANAAITTLINSLIAKINALNKLVIKIQKKVRA